MWSKVKKYLHDHHGGVPAVHYRAISALRVTMDFNVRTDAAGLAEALKMVDELAVAIRACPQVQSLHIGRLVELGGVFCEGGEPQRHEVQMQGILSRLTEDGTDG